MGSQRVRQDWATELNWTDVLQNIIKLVETKYAHKPPEEKEKQINLLMQKHDERMKNKREKAEMNVFQAAFNMIKNMLSKIWPKLWYSWFYYNFLIW